MVETNIFDLGKKLQSVYTHFRQSNYGMDSYEQHMEARGALCEQNKMAPINHEAWEWK